jgi:enamine deaminase RidA (YjgF/YER057c/UK114 family)
MSVEDTLQSMGLALPPPARPVASYIPAVRTGNLVYTSGQIPTRDGKLTRRGQVGLEISEDDAYEEARTCTLNALAAIKDLIGSLDSITQVVKVTGYVNSADGFTDQATVVNGASDLLVKLFGDRGRHARAAVGVAELPLDAPVEVDLIVEVGD